jgi:acid stress chaperone HdeB
MKGFLAAAIVAAMAVVGAQTTASAETLDASAFSCADLTESANSSDKQGQLGASMILHWLHAYLGTEEQGTVIDANAMTTVFDQTKKFCSENPNIGVMTAAKKYMGENEPKPGKDALDVSVLTCEIVQEMAEKDENATAELIMWVMGYHASSGDDTLIDMTKMDTATKKMGSYCSDNKNVSFLTASEKMMGIEQGSADEK